MISKKYYKNYDKIFKLPWTFTKTQKRNEHALFLFGSFSLLLLLFLSGSACRVFVF